MIQCQPHMTMLPKAHYLVTPHVKVNLSAAADSRNHTLASERSPTPQLQLPYLSSVLWSIKKDYYSSLALPSVSSNRAQPFLSDIERWLLPLGVCRFFLTILFIN